MEGQEWREHRVKLSPVFTTGKMKLMFEILDTIGDKLVEAVDKELKITDKLEVRELLSKFTTDVISSIAFGIDSNCKSLAPNKCEYVSTQAVATYAQCLKTLTSPVKPNFVISYQAWKTQAPNFIIKGENFLICQLLSS